MSHRGRHVNQRGRARGNVTNSPVKAPKGDFVEIDGSVLEGGGQILRMAAAYSAILNKPIHVTKIRAGRSPGGLKAQHLTGLELTAQLCSGTLTGGFIGSAEVWLQPRGLRGGHCTADPGTAGSISLLAQVALPCLLFTQNAENHVQLRGGTNVAFSPPIELIQLLLAMLKKHCGVECGMTIEKRGFFPKGGGQVMLTTTSNRLSGNKYIQPIELDVANTKEVSKIDVEIVSYPKAAPAEFKGIAEQQVESAFAQHGLKSPARVNVNLAVPTGTTPSSGQLAFMLAQIGDLQMASDGLIDRGVNLESAIANAADFLARNIASGGAVDEHMQDQLIIFAVLARGRSRIRTGALTLHTQTAIHISQLMTDAKIDVQKNDDNTNTIIVDGIGFESPA